MRVTDSLMYVCYQISSSHFTAVAPGKTNNQPKETFSFDAPPTKGR